MANFNSLPHEIQKLIFQQVDTTRQLGQCRLVCKSWDAPAECAMFGKALHITDCNTESIYMHLSTKPARAKLIKEIVLDCRFTDATSQLLRLAMTPGVERIVTSNPEQPKQLFYHTLHDILKYSETKFQCIKSIPWPNPLTDTHYQIVLLLKNSLEEITIGRLDDNEYHRRITSQLQNFNQLSKLCLHCTFDDLAHVETVLRGAPKLEEIKLGNCFCPETNNWSKQDTLNWIKQHVEIRPNALTLNILPRSDQSAANITELLLYKYPNINHFSCDFKRLLSNNEDFMDTHLSLGISRIPNYTITFSLGQIWKSDYEYLLGDKSLVRLIYVPRKQSRLRFNNQITSKLNHNQERISTFEFHIDDRIDSPQPHNDHANVFGKLADYTTAVYMDFVSYRADISIESRAAFQALEVINHLEDMKLVLRKLTSVEMKWTSQDERRRFNTLEIGGATIQPAAFWALGHRLHTINTLTLSCCYIEKDQTNTMCIHMPSTKLGKLLITTKFDPIVWHNFHSRIRDKIASSQDIYLVLNLQQDITLYLMIKPSCKDVYQLSPDEYYGRPANATSLSIQCQSIGSIELDLGNVCTEIDVQKHYEMSGMAFDKMEM